MHAEPCPGCFGSTRGWWGVKSCSQYGGTGWVPVRDIALCAPDSHPSELEYLPDAVMDLETNTVVTVSLER